MYGYFILLCGDIFHARVQYKYVKCKVYTVKLQGKESDNSMWFFFTISTKVIQVHLDFNFTFSSLFTSCLQLTHVRALESIGWAGAVWKFAGKPTLAGHQLPDSTWFWWSFHLTYIPTAIVICGLSMSLPIWHSWLSPKTLSSNGSLIARTEAVHVKPQVCDRVLIPDHSSL